MELILNGGKWKLRIDKYNSPTIQMNMYLSKERKVPMLDINNSKYKILQWISQRLWKSRNYRD